MPPTLILASTSRYRHALLARLRLPFEVASPGVDETPLNGEGPLERASRLSLAKAMAVAVKSGHCVAIGSDQVAVCGDQLLEKPGDSQRCREQLRQLSGKSAVFYTAVAVVGSQGASAQQFVDTTTVTFRILDDGEIDRYIEAEQPFDCAGGFRCEALGIALFERVICEDPTALIGLPLIRVAAALRICGYVLP